MLNAGYINRTALNADQPAAGGTTYTVTRESLLSVTDGRSKLALLFRSDATEMFDGGGAKREYNVRAGSGLSPIDGSMRTAVRGRVADDTLALLDSFIKDVVTAGQTYTLTRTSLLDVTDAERTLHWQVLLSDVAALIDDKIATYIPGYIIHEQTKTDLITLLDGHLRNVYRNRHASDTLVLSDATIRSALRNRLAQDSVSLADGLIRSTLRNRLASDAITLIDSAVADIVTGNQTYIETLTSLLDVTDAERTLHWQVLLSDVATLIDDKTASIVGSGTTFTETKSDAITLADATLRSALRNRLLGDSVVVADALLKVMRYTRLTTDNITLADELLASLIGGSVVFRTASDAFNLYDNYGSTRQYDVRAGDGATVTDSATPTITGGSGTTYTNTRTSNLLATDSASKFTRRNRTQSDALTVDDAGRQATWTIVSSDYLSLFDAISHVLTGGAVLTRTATDTLSPVDSAIRYLRAHRMPTDTVGVTDAAVKTTRRNRRTEDTITVSDGELHQWFGAVTNRTATDGILVTDDGRTIYWSVRSTDTSAIYDSASATTSQQYLTTRRMTEEVRVGDQMFHVLLRSRFITDSFPLYDHVGRMPREIVVRATDEQMLTDAYNKFVGTGGGANSVTLTDNVTVTDDGHTMYWRITRSEYVSLYEQLIYTAGEFNAIFRTASDTIAFTDQLLRRLLRQRALTDGVTLYDAQSLSFWQEIVATATDEAVIDDSAPRTAFLHRRLSDAIALADSIIGGSLPSTYSHTATDLLEVTDNTIRTVRAVRLATDTLAVIDAIIAQVYATGDIYNLTRSDTFSLTDMAFRSVERGRTLADQFALNDELLKQRLYDRGLFDAIEIVDDTIKVRWNRRTLTDYLDITDEQLSAYVPFLPFVFRTRIILAGGDPIAVLIATDDIRLFAVDPAMVLAGLEDNPLAGDDARIILGGYN